MPESEDQRASNAADASGEQIPLYVHDTSPRVMRALLGNPLIREEHILVIAGRKNLPGEILGSIYKDRRWTDSYPVRLALAKNPKTPLFTALSIARYLRLFDLSDLARNGLLPVIYRKKVEAIVTEKVPSLALGIKKTLARTASGEILLSLMQDGYPEVVSACLDNPAMVEAHIYKIVNRSLTRPSTIRVIADHRAWSRRYSVKYALVRNQHTPLSRCALFLAGLKIQDLKDLYRDPLLPGAVRPVVHRELVGRGADPDLIPENDEETFIEIDEQEIDGIEGGIRVVSRDHQVQGDAPEDGTL